MIKIKLVFVICLFCIFSGKLIANPPLGPLFEEEGPYQYRDNTEFESRELGTNPPVMCSCPCSEMVQGARILDPNIEDAAYLSGGVTNGTLHCQKLELNIKACNNQPINNIGITFNLSNATNKVPCFNSTQYIYRLDANGNPVSSGSFEPQEQEYSTTLSFGDEPIPACSSRKVTFLICTINYCMFTTVDIELDLSSSANGFCQSRILHLYYDGVTGIGGKINPDTDKGYKEIELNTSFIEEFYDYKIVDILSNTLIEGKSQTKDKIKENLENNSCQPGLYILQYIKNDKIVHQEKIYKSY